METCIWKRNANDQSSCTFWLRVLQHVHCDSDGAHCDGKAIKIIDSLPNNWSAEEASWRCPLMKGWVIITTTWWGPIGALLAHLLCMKLIHGTRLPTANHVVSSADLWKKKSGCNQLDFISPWTSAGRSLLICILKKYLCYVYWFLVDAFIQRYIQYTTLKTNNSWLKIYLACLYLLLKKEQPEIFSSWIYAFLLVFIHTSTCCMKASLSVYMDSKMDESTLNGRFGRVLMGNCDILYRKHFKGLIVLWIFQGEKISLNLFYVFKMDFCTNVRLF